MKKHRILIVFILVATFIIGNIASASGFVHFRSIASGLLSDYTLTSSNNEITLRVVAGSNSERLTLKMMTITSRARINSFFTIPKGATPATDLYFVKFSPVNIDNFTTQPELEIKYEADNNYKEAYFYDWMVMKFVKLESVRDELNQTLTVKLPKRKKIMIALFNESELTGKASWYVYPKYAGELIAASRDFAKGTQVKVVNLYNDREVIVTIRDFGPKKCENWTDREQELMGPCQERILDLSKTAFLQLATTTGVGIISNIKITPVEE